MLKQVLRSETVSVLVVDDDVVIQDMLTTALDIEGYEVSRAGDGFEALGAIALETPDVVVLDVMMPRMDGLSLARRIRGEPEFGDVGIVFVSARVSDDAVWEGWTAGADSYLTKPVDVEELVGEIDRVVQARRAA